MKLSHGRLAAFLLGAVLAFPAFFGASWAREQVVSGYPTFTEGDEIWGRKSGTTNTKEDVVVTSGALHVNVAGSSGTTAVEGETADGASAASTLPVNVGGVDGSGNLQQFLTDTSGRPNVVGVPTSSASQGMTPVVSSAAESNKVLKASAGNLYALTITTGVTAGYLMVFNATSAPADGAVTPTYCIPVAANTGTPISFAPFPYVFSTGITAVFSTTGCFTKTASATAAFFGQVQ